MNEVRIQRMLRELRADPITAFLEDLFCHGQADPPLSSPAARAPVEDDIVQWGVGAA